MVPVDHRRTVSRNVSHVMPKVPLEACAAVGARQNVAVAKTRLGLLSWKHDQYQSFVDLFQRVFLHRKGRIPAGRRLLLLRGMSQQCRGVLGAVSRVTLAGLLPCAPMSSA